MRVIGLELSDAGIMAAADGRCIEVDGENLESPGFSLAEKKRYRIGCEAEQRAHLNPRDIVNTFWDRLDAAPIKQPGFEGSSHAELAYAHLEKIWGAVKKHGEKLVIAVPDYLDPEQLGRILAMTTVLAIPMVGFAPISIAATTTPHPGKLLAFVDMHLHRAVVTVFSQSDRLFAVHTESVSDMGRYGLYAAFAKIVAEAFVRQTRYDPFHRAASEQQLFNRLPEILKDLRADTGTLVKMRAGLQTHQAALSRDAFLEKIQPVFDAVCRVIETVRKDTDAPDAPVLLQLSHRAAAFFGFKDIRSNIPGLEMTSLAPGAAALGALSLVEQFSDGTGASLLSSRKWTDAGEAPENGAATRNDQTARPTHLLFKNLAYPISEEPLVIGKETAAGGIKICKADGSAEISDRYFSIQMEGEDIVLNPDGKNDVSTDGVKVTETAVLKLGQKIRVEGLDDTFLLIACV
jgi:hypothetical protein